MWLVADRFAREMRARVAVGLVASAEAQATFAAATVAASDGQPRNLKIAGDVAEIGVEGLLTQRPDFYAWLFGYGNTTYSDIQQSLAIAQADPTIKRVVFRVNSPGGQVDGLFDTLAALDAFGKPTSVTTSLAASAAYAIAALGGKIEATNAAVEVGSIGVATEFWVDDHVVQIASTNAPNKRPDVTTDAGKAVIRAELDALHDVFVDAIAKGRGTSVVNVNESFGRGGLVIAGHAKSLGMIDKIQKPALRAIVAPASEPAEPMPGASAPAPTVASAADDVAGETPPAVVAPAQSIPSAAAEKQAAQPKGKPMDQNTLKAEHPELFASVQKQAHEEGHASGLAEGETKERKRVCAHLKMGAKCGAMTYAVKAIESGASMLDEDVMAEYMSSASNRADQTARQSESDAAGAAVAGAAPPPPADETVQDKVAARLERKYGVAS